MAHPHDILILAVTRMRSGVCVAGMSGQAHPGSLLRWVRPIKRMLSSLIRKIKTNN